jgi:phosphohistidine phosphatase
MDLYIIRHAWAYDRDEQQWPNDDLRPLTKDGAKRFAKVAQQWVDRGVRPTIIASSPLVRCVETSKILGTSLGSVEIVELDALRPGSDLDALLEWTGRQSDKHASIAWVGHAPDVDRWTAALIGDGGAGIRFSKGAAAALRFDGPAALRVGMLRWLVTAKLIGE